jgi:hypothetical protein
VKEDTPTTGELYQQKPAKTVRFADFERLSIIEEGNTEESQSLAIEKQATPPNFARNPAAPANDIGAHQPDGDRKQTSTSWNSLFIPQDEDLASLLDHDDKDIVFLPARDEMSYGLSHHRYLSELDQKIIAERVIAPGPLIFNERKVRQNPVASRPRPLNGREGRPLTEREERIIRNAAFKAERKKEKIANIIALANKNQEIYDLAALQESQVALKESQVVEANPLRKSLDESEKMKRQRDPPGDR